MSKLLIPTIALIATSCNSKENDKQTNVSTELAYIDFSSNKSLINETYTNGRLTYKDLNTKEQYLVTFKKEEGLKQLSLKAGTYSFSLHLYLGNEEVYSTSFCEVNEKESNTFKLTHGKNVVKINLCQNKNKAPVNPNLPGIDPKEPIDENILTYTEYCQQYDSQSQEIKNTLDGLYFIDPEDCEEKPWALGWVGWVHIASSKPVDLKPIAKLTQLQKLTLSISLPVDLSVLKDLPNLEVIGFWENSSIDKSISSLKHITSISFNNYELESLEAIKDLTGLKALEFHRTSVKSFSPSNIFENLEELTISNPGMQRFDVDISFLNRSKNLNSLLLVDINVENYQLIANFNRLESLDLINAGIEDLSFVENLNNLNSIHIGENNIKDISPLKDMKGLKIDGLESLPIEKSVEACPYEGIENTVLKQH